jgi:hypothetical protein
MVAPPVLRETPVHRDTEAATRVTGRWLSAVVAAGAIAITHAASLAVMVGYVGASRALTLGPTVYVAEHAPALVASLLAALFVAVIAQVGAGGAIAFWRVLVVIGGAYVVVAGLLTELVGELALPDLPRLLPVITGLGGVLVAAGAGLTVGRLVRR